MWTHSSMGMHTYKPPVAVRLPEDRLTRRIAQRQARRILALRLGRRLSRLSVVGRTGINWKRIRALEEGSSVACIDEVMKLAALFSIHPITLIREIAVIPGKRVSVSRSRRRQKKGSTHL